MMRSPAACLVLAAGLCVAVCAALPASAQTKAIGRYKDWRVYTEGTGKNQICFAATSAEDASPKNVDHGDVDFFVATWKSGSASNQPSLRVGYDLRTDLAPRASVGRDRFRMYASGSEAFFPDGEESSLIKAVKKGRELRIEAVSKKSERTAYSFSLQGSTDAIEKAHALCR